MSLSGGQRQRLSLARAILAAPKILVLDDTLSALDVHTEAVVEEALRRVLQAPSRESLWRIALPRFCSPTRWPCWRMARSPTSVPTPNCSPRCPSTATCSPPTTNSTTAPNRACAWEDDRDRSRLDHAVEEREALERDPARSDGSPPRRPSADDRHRHPGYRGARMARQVRKSSRTTCRSTKACRGGVRHAPCWARCCAPTGSRSRCSPSSSSWKTRRPFGSDPRAARHRRRHSRRSSTAARLTRC